MLKALLIEDESYIRKGLIALINSLEKDIDIIGECCTVKEAVTVTKACKPDLLFLDINLPDGNAFHFLEQIEPEQINFKIIFITAYREYAIQALKLGAVDYILKPIEIEELEIAIDKVIETPSILQQENISVAKEHFVNERLVVSLQDGYQIINHKDLKYCKSDKGYTTFYVANDKTYVASKPLKYFIDSLPDSKFIRIHQSCVVNLDYIDKYDKSGVIILKDAQTLPVSVRKKEAFLARLLNRK